MVQDAFTLYKLIVLYMLDQANMMLTNAQISNFILEKEYTDFFTIQSAISYLEENRFITVETIRNNTNIQITKEGKAVLGYCIGEISSGIKQDVKEYLEENKNEIREDTMVVADYFEAGVNEYTARCIIKSGDSNVVEINLNTASEEEANTVCIRWKEKSQEVYAYLIQQLLAE